MVPSLSHWQIEQLGKAEELAGSFQRRAELRAKLSEEEVTSF